MRRKKALTLVVLFLVIGFAVVSTTLVINSKIGIGFNEKDFRVYISNISVYQPYYEQEQSNLLDDTHAEFYCDFSLVDDSCQVLYYIKNDSTNYDAKIELKISGDNEYIYLENTFDSESELIPQEERQGYLYISLDKPYDGGENNSIKEIKITMEITATPLERDWGPYGNMPKREEENFLFNVQNDGYLTDVYDVGDGLILGVRGLYMPYQKIDYDGNIIWNKENLPSNMVYNGTNLIGLSTNELKYYDSDGNFLKSVSINGENEKIKNYYIQKVVYNDGYICELDSLYEEASNPTIIKISDTGDIEWENEYDGRIVFMANYEENIFIYLYNLETEQSSYILIDREGNKVLEKQDITNVYYTEFDNYGDEFYALGYSKDEEFYVTKFDSNFNEIWSKKYQTDDTYGTIHKTNEGIFIATTYISPNNDNNYINIIKLDNEGNVEWLMPHLHETRYTSNFYLQMRNIVEHDDKIIFLSTKKPSSGSGVNGFTYNLGIYTK